MRVVIRKAVSSPVFVFAGALLWGIVEFVALQRSRRRVARGRRLSGSPRAPRTN